ncbi:MAG: class I SAM-dependent methyltransferase [Anaerolineae bacterium]
MLARLYEAFDPIDVESVAAFVYWLAESYGLRGRLRLLDMGCGTGRTLPGFTALGWSVTGMEPNTQLSSRPEIVVGGFADLNEQNTYHIVTAINGPYSYLLARADRLDALSRVHRALLAGGIILLDVWNFIAALRHYADPPPVEKVVGGQHVRLQREHIFDFHHATISQVETYNLPDGSLHTLTHTLAILTQPQIAAELQDAGFDDIRTFPGYASRRPAPVTGSQMLIAARVP